MNRRQALLSAAAVMAAGTVAPTPTRSQTSPPAQAFSADDLARRSIERRAVEAVIWGMPAVNYHLMYQEMVRKAKAASTRFFTGRACSTGRTRRSRRIPT